MSRIIFHIDMNSFFVSCEIAENHDLYGKCVAVAHTQSSRKSIVLAASYEAKAKGVKTTMHIGEAMRICPDLIIVDCNYHLYSDYSKRFFEYFYSITPLVEPASIDEGFLDVTEVCQKENPIDLAIRMQKEILTKFGLPCSIGIGPNKFLAKMASDMKKPLGITVLRKREISKFLWPLPIEALLGVGKKTAPVLHRIGIHTIGDLANYQDLNHLKEEVGPTVADSLYRHAHGEGSSEIDPNRFDDPASISNSYTFDVDVYDLYEVKQMLKILTNSVCNRLEKSNNKAQSFTVQIKYNNFRTVSRSQTISKATNDNQKVYHLIEDLFDDLYDDTASGLGIRLVGVASSKFESYEEKNRQLSIFDSFDEIEKDHAINTLINSLNVDFGKDVLVRGVKKHDKG